VRTVPVGAGALSGRWTTSRCGPATILLGNDENAAGIEIPMSVQAALRPRYGLALTGVDVATISADGRDYAMVAVQAPRRRTFLSLKANDPWRKSLPTSPAASTFPMVMGSRSTHARSDSAAQGTVRLQMRLRPAMRRARPVRLIGEIGAREPADYRPAPDETHAAGGTVVRVVDRRRIRHSMTKAAQDRSLAIRLEVTPQSNRTAIAPGSHRDA